MGEFRHHFTPSPRHPVTPSPHHPVRIAIIDSGIHAAHPHVRGDVAGVGLRPDGTLDADFVDRLGHGTAVAAAIRERMPDAQLLAIKVFWSTLETDAPTLARAIELAAELGASIANLSLGTTTVAHAARLSDAVERARRGGAFVVAAMDDGQRAWMPGALPGTIGVRVDWNIERDTVRIEQVDGRRIVAASGYPRDIPGVPRERNLKGVSFAVANATGLIARALEAHPAAGVEELLDALITTRGGA